MKLSLADYLSDVGLGKWITEIGVTDAPVPRQNIGIALHFFSSQMPGLPIEHAVGFIAAMDLSKPVKRVRLQPDERLIGFRTGCESPFKLFFARRGQSMYASGIHTAGRGVVHFIVRASVEVLESYTTAAIDSWTKVESRVRVVLAPRAKKWFGKEFGVLAIGGGSQLIIPHSVSHLLVEERHD